MRIFPKNVYTIRASFINVYPKNIPKTNFLPKVLVIGKHVSLAFLFDEVIVYQLFSMPRHKCFVNSEFLYYASLKKEGFSPTHWAAGEVAADG
ncbi:MAG: hypothetical protein LBB16_02670 [Puniceicoccales bacterium]|jgi:hypothetical protein|nr:hypothetical protein [Puniceicoccales bacterium]